MYSTSCIKGQKSAMVKALIFIKYHAGQELITSYVSTVQCTLQCPVYSGHWTVNNVHCNFETIRQSTNKAFTVHFLKQTNPPLLIMARSLDAQNDVLEYM